MDSSRVVTSGLVRFLRSWEVLESEEWLISVEVKGVGHYAIAVNG